MAVWVADPWGLGGGFYADILTEEERATVSPLLGPDGRPLQYEPRQPVGFDLSKREK